MEKINRIIKSVIICVFCAITLVAGSKSATAGSGIALISDTETQKYLADVIKPLFKVAQINFNENTIFIVNDASLNAFVSDGNYLFVNTGTIIGVANTNELSGVLAHETGHILGGHILKQKLKMENLQYAMLGSMLAAGAAAVSTGRGDAAMAIILGSQSSALNSLLHYQLEDERSADEAAIKLLTATKQSTLGLRNFMNKIRQQNALSGIEENQYFRTHPMTNERISHFDEASKGNKFSTKSNLDDEFLFVKAKIFAFLYDSPKAWRQYPKTRVDLPAKYAHAILYFRDGKITEALKTIDYLIEKKPDNPYFYELKGQFLFETGKVKNSIAEYKKSLQLLPNAPQIQLALAHSLIESEPSKEDIKYCIDILQQSIIKLPTPDSWQLLSQAYSLNGDYANSYYAAAEFNYQIHNFEASIKQLERAKKAKPSQALELKISDLLNKIKDDKKNENTF